MAGSGDRNKPKRAIAITEIRIVKQSDGLNGEIFTEDGWFAKYSRYGENGI